MAEPAFDPDLFLAQTAPKRSGSAAPSEAFDPDKFLADTAPPVAPEQAQDQPLKMMNTVKNAVLAPIAYAGSAIDRFTGAPVRAAIGAAQDGRNSSQAFLKQFTMPSETAPTGKEIAAKAGLSTEESIPLGLKGLDQKTMKVSPAGVAGLGIDVAADPTNLIPGELVAKGILKGAGKATVMGIGGGAKGIDAITGTKVAGGAFNAARETANATSLALSHLFKPARAADFGDMVKIATKNGIDPGLLSESVEFGPSSVITRASRVKAEGPLGQQALEKFEKGYNQVRNATTRKLEQISGGPILSKQEAGGLIRRSYDEAVGRLFEGADNTYGQIAQRNPNMTIAPAESRRLDSALNGLEEFAKGRLQRGVSAAQKSQAKQLLDAVAAVRSTGKPELGFDLGPNNVLQKVERPALPTSFSGVVEVLRNTGEAAYAKKGLLELDPPDVKRLQGLYGDLREAVINSIETGMPDGAAVASSLRQKNTEIAKFMAESEGIEKALSARSLSDEGLFRNLIEGGDSIKIASLKQILTPEQFQALKGTMLNEMLSKDLEGNFTFKTAINKMKGKKTQLESLLDPAEAKDVADLLILGDRFGPSVMSTSGTGASQQFKEIMAGVKDSIVSESFIESLKKRARGGDEILGDAPGALSGAAKVVEGTGPVNTGGPVQKLMNATSRNPVERRLKGSQTYSTQDTEDNKKRRDAIRRRLGE